MVEQTEFEKLINALCPVLSYIQEAVSIFNFKGVVQTAHILTGEGKSAKEHLR